MTSSRVEPPYCISAGEYARLDGRVAVVTGSASGIGRAIALELAAAGADVLVHTRERREQAEQVAHAIQQLGRRTAVVLADLRCATARGQLLDQAWSFGKGHVDIWVNNAGADVLTGEAARMPFTEKLQLLWEVDVCATIELSRAAGVRMKGQATRSGEKALLNMGWDQALTGMEGDSGQLFAAAKGAIMSFTLSLARTLAPEVRVNCLAPGWIRTAWGEKASSVWQQRARDESLLGRWGTPEDVAQVARFLVSPAASFITCQIVPINGGLRIGRVGTSATPRVSPAEGAGSNETTHG